MGYRDELQAARARNAALERELAEARREIADLKGESRALIPTAGAETALARRERGLPKLLSSVREYRGALSAEALAEIAEFLSESASTHTTELTVMTGSVLWKGAAEGGYEKTVRVSSRRGQVVAKMEINLAAMGLSAGAVGGLAAAGSGLAIAAGAAILALPAALGLLPVIPVAWWTKRRLHRRWCRRQVEGYEKGFDELLTLVESLIEPEDVESAKDVEPASASVKGM